MEIERPCCYREYCQSDRAWNELGMRIKWTEPSVPGTSEISMLEPFTLKLCLECKKPIPLRDVSAWAWTHMYHKDNIEGIYREIKLIYDEKSRKWNEWGVTTYEFLTSVLPTHTAEFRLTFNVKFREYMIWVNLFQVDHIATITPCKDISTWTKLVNTTQITHNIHLGNYLAVLLAEELDCDAVLNLHKQSESKTDNDNLQIIRVFKTTSVEPGAGNFIAPDKIKDIVSWLKDSVPVYNKILIGDREGRGRAGSAMTSYIFANNPNLTFEEAYRFVYSRRFIYCHQGLKDTLYSLYPRD